METFYHGTSVLFKEFDLGHALEGAGKVKMGLGIYLTNGYKRAALYSTKSPGAKNYYVYTVEIPDLTPENHIEFKMPVNPAIVKRAEEKLGEPIPQEETVDGKLFRKYIAMTLAGKTPSQKLTIEDENKAVQLLLGIGVIYEKVPFVWKDRPAIHYDVVVMKEGLMRIVKIEQVDMTNGKKRELVEGSQREVPLDSF